jgi:hypothetical protein
LIRHETDRSRSRLAINMNETEVLTMLKRQCPDFFAQAFDGEQYELWTNRAKRLFLIVSYDVRLYRDYDKQQFSTAYEYKDGQLDELKMFEPEYGRDSLIDARQYLREWYHDARQI